MASVWRPEDNRWESVLSFHHSSPWTWTRHQAESAARTSTQPYSQSHLPTPVGPPHRSTGTPLIIHLRQWMHLSPLATSAWLPWDGQCCCLRKDPGVDVLDRYGGAGEVEEVLDTMVFHYKNVWNSQEQRKRSEESMLDNGRSVGIIARKGFEEWPDLFCFSPAGTHSYECSENTLLLGPGIRPITENFLLCYLSVRNISQISFQNRNSKFHNSCFYKSSLGCLIWLLEAYWLPLSLIMKTMINSLLPPFGTLTISVCLSKKTAQSFMTAKSSVLISAIIN